MSIGSIPNHHGSSSRCAWRNVQLSIWRIVRNARASAMKAADESIPRHEAGSCAGGLKTPEALTATQIEYPLAREGPTVAPKQRLEEVIPSLLVPHVTPRFARHGTPRGEVERVVPVLGLTENGLRFLLGQGAIDIRRLLTVHRSSATSISVLRFLEQNPLRWRHR